MAPLCVQVTVEAVSGLQKSHAGIISRKPNPYVIVEVVGKEERRFQTPVIRSSSAPAWNFTGNIDGFEFGDKLQFLLMDNHSWPRSDKVLGRASLIPEDLDDCRVDLGLAECETNALLSVAVFAASATSADEQIPVTRGSDMGLAEVIKPVQQFSVADQSSMLDKDNCAETSDGNCHAHGVDAGEECNDQVAITLKSVPLEGTDSTRLSTPQSTNSDPMLMVPMEAEQAPLFAPCGPPPIIYSRAVHAPVTVSAQEFARVLAGIAVVAPAEISVVKPCSGSAPNAQKQEKTQHHDVKSTQPVKIKRKARRCC